MSTGRRFRCGGDNLQSPASVSGDWMTSLRGQELWRFPSDQIRIVQCAHKPDCKAKVPTTAHSSMDRQLVPFFLPRLCPCSVSRSVVFASLLHPRHLGTVLAPCLAVGPSPLFAPSRQTNDNYDHFRWTRYYDDSLFRQPRVNPQR